MLGPSGILEAGRKLKVVNLVLHVNRDAKLKTEDYQTPFSPQILAAFVLRL